jgi:hypothetical protein
MSGFTLASLCGWPAASAWLLATAIGSAAIGAIAGVVAGWLMWADRRGTEPPKGLDLDVPANRERLEKWLRETAPPTAPDA